MRVSTSQMRVADLAGLVISFYLSILSPFGETALIFSGWYDDRRHTSFARIATRFARLLVRNYHEEENEREKKGCNK